MKRILDGLRWLNENEARLHSVGCSIHDPSPNCSCGAREAIDKIVEGTSHLRVTYEGIIAGLKLDLERVSEMHKKAAKRAETVALQLADCKKQKK